MLPAHRIGHVHAKDCRVEGHRPVWGPLGEGAIDWRGQIAALVRDGYRGWVSLETHWPGPDGNKLEGSRICGRNLARPGEPVSYCFFFSRFHNWRDSTRPQKGQ